MVTKQGSTLALGVLVSAAVAVDFGVQANVVLGLRAIFALAPEARGRLNGIYIATFFAAGALGSALGASAYAEGGWTLASRIGLRCPLIALARFVFRLATGAAQAAPATLDLTPSRHAATCAHSRPLSVRLAGSPAPPMTSS